MLARRLEERKAGKGETRQNGEGFLKMLEEKDNIIMMLRTKLEENKGGILGKEPADVSPIRYSSTVKKQPQESRFESTFINKLPFKMELNV